MENQQVTILLVEDNAGDVRLLEESFQRSDSAAKQLLVARSGADALKLLGKDRTADPLNIGLILLDLTLPDTSGCELLGQIRQLPQCRHIPVVVLTGSNSDEDMRRSYASGANAYLVKPVDLGRFVRMLNTLDAFWMGLVSVPTALSSSGGTEA